VDLFTHSVKHFTTYHTVVGVMAARGMLENPAMFAGYGATPAACVKDWVRHLIIHEIDAIMVKKITGRLNQTLVHYILYINTKDNFRIQCTFMLSKTKFILHIFM